MAVNSTSGIEIAKFSHEPVMSKAALEGLSIRPDGFYVDATFGRGGHSQLILQQLGPDGRLLLIDQDPEAIVVANALAQRDARCLVRHGCFDQLSKWVSEIGVLPDGVLLDLGVSSPQLDDPKRGFSFMRDGPLDMRMNSSTGQTACQWLATVTETELAHVLWRYGDEKCSRRIAKTIVEHRVDTAIETTGQLAGLIEKASPRREKGKHPATRSFQAIRIFINQELVVLDRALIAVADCLPIGGRLSVISFHSLEDRVVKRFIKNFGVIDIPEGLPVTGRPNAGVFKAILKAQKADATEVRENVRSRSAVLRVAEKVADVTPLSTKNRSLNREMSS